MDWPTAPVRPECGPRQLSVQIEQRIERLRRNRELGPDRIAYELRREGLRVSASGVYRVLVRLGINRLRDLDPPTAEQLRTTDPATAAHDGPRRMCATS